MASLVKPAYIGSNDDDIVGSRVEDYKDELRSRGYWLLDGVLASSPGFGSTISELPLHYTVYHAAQMQPKLCDRFADVAIAGARCEHFAAYTVKILDKVRNGMAVWLKARQEILVQNIASQHSNVPLHRKYYLAEVCVPLGTVYIGQLKLLEVFDTQNAVYMIQELAGMGSIADNIPAGGMSEKRCRLILAGVVNGVKFLHRFNIVHRNLTCESIWLDANETPKITDFSVACKVPSYNYELFQDVGTDEYKAPELLLSQPYNGFALDIWNIGAVMYVMLFNCQPYMGQPDFNTLQLRRLDFSGRSLSLGAKEVMRKTMHFQQKRRPRISTLLQLKWFNILEADTDQTAVTGSGRQVPFIADVVDRSQAQWITFHTKDGKLESVPIKSRHFSREKIRLRLLERRVVAAASSQRPTLTKSLSTSSEQPPTVPYQKSCSFCHDPPRPVTTNTQVFDNQPPLKPYRDRIVQYRNLTPWIESDGDQLKSALNPSGVGCVRGQCRKDSYELQMTDMLPRIIRRTSRIMGLDGIAEDRGVIPVLPPAPDQPKPSTRPCSPVTAAIRAVLANPLDDRMKNKLALAVATGVSVKVQEGKASGVRTESKGLCGRTKASGPVTVAATASSRGSGESSKPSLVNPEHVIHSYTSTDFVSKVSSNSAQLKTDLGSPNPSGHVRPRYAELEERRESKIWESLSARSSNASGSSKIILTLDHLKDVDLRTESILETSLHSVTEVDEGRSRPESGH